VTERQLKIRRRIALVYLYGLSLLRGVHGILTDMPLQTESGMRIATASFVALALAAQLGFMWFCTLDARLVGRPLPQLARIGIFCGWPLGVPIYLIWARRWRGVGLLLLHGFLLLLICVATYVTGVYLRYGPEAFT